MIHFQLPRNTPFIYQYLECLYTEGNYPVPVVSNSLSRYLNDIKKKIDSKSTDWDLVKRYTNPYEYIHTLIPGKKKSVAKKKPLSRSYFKMIEILQFFKLLENYKNDDIHCFHLAEGPGGFIEAIVNIRNNENDHYIGMSILDDKNDPNIPAWKKSKQFLQEHSNVVIDHGIDGTGDILKLENFTYCKNKFGNKMHIITGDGGFDFSVDFNNQEHHIIKLLFGQVIYAVVMQRLGGHFVLKLFDCFLQHTLDILALLSSLYEKVYIIKPQTSRYANSEKYIVCKNFIGPKCDILYKYLYTCFENLLSSQRPINRLLNIPLTLLFTTKIEEYNAIFGQQQIENIHYTLNLIETENKEEKYNILLKNNIKKCSDWCIKYGVLFNNINHNTSTNNVFLDDVSISTSC